MVLTVHTYLSQMTECFRSSNVFVLLYRTYILTVVDVLVRVHVLLTVLYYVGVRER